MRLLVLGYLILIYVCYKKSVFGSSDIYMDRFVQVEMVLSERMERSVLSVCI